MSLLYFSILFTLVLASTATSTITSTATSRYGSTFVNECITLLLAVGEDDGLISSSEYAAFWSNVTGTESDFNSLDIQLQLSFVWIVCSDPDTQTICLAELEADGNGFGYTLSTNSKAVVGQQIQELCENVYLYAINNELSTGIQTTQLFTNYSHCLSVL